MLASPTVSGQGGGCTLGIGWAGGVEFEVDRGWGWHAG